MTSTPLPEQGGFNEKLDKILEDYGKYVYFEGDPKRGGTMDKAKAKAAIRTLVLEEMHEVELQCFVYMAPDRIQDYKNYRDSTFQNDPRLGDTNGTK